MTAKERYKLDSSIKRRLANQGDRIYIINENNIIHELSFFHNAKEVKTIYPNCKIIRSRKMTYKEMVERC